MRFEVGQRIIGKINNITDYGIFVSFKNKSGLIYKDDFKDGWEREKLRFQPGQEIKVVITQIKDKKIALSLKRVNDPDLVDPNNQFKDLSKEAFASTLTELAGQAKKTIKDLRDGLN
ncbi:S1 RNA-binding domain-containing protein [Lactobacillus jensenii]|jgi:RNA-binding protein|uniref:S1 RNA-binding domain-containing protein n=1 Tax=Lactobacillus jensenii TaxID=109790 RepID=A0A5N1IDX2_LACJE|nr:S1 RNA-binding domain-containing protein [Lactobacillus jensenii]ERJ42211.1 RNA-binding protein [Lactobacillus jensenii MD IIE-70(2)]APT14198.1 RNA-binding protein [Lactobacillus jensenii]EEX27281.1 S1 RNA binding domain protein [Lactobacillus jensenii SJ-7A-US]KAA9236400.1 S1 RNA-binding domain-containing protein [Lactobacillus jensenii]KAA9259138.1 S1 RNA-binding domain-containing protein [Lactobacillus jensenii]